MYNHPDLLPDPEDEPPKINGRMYDEEPPNLCQCSQMHLGCCGIFDIACMNEITQEDLLCDLCRTKIPHCHLLNATKMTRDRAKFPGDFKTREQRGMRGIEYREDKETFNYWAEDNPEPYMPSDLDRKTLEYYKDIIDPEMERLAAEWRRKYGR